MSRTALRVGDCLDRNRRAVFSVQIFTLALWRKSVGFW